MISLIFAKALMGVHTTVFSIFAMFFEFTGNVKSDCWRPMLFKLEDFNFQSLEQVLVQKTEVLAHAEETS